MFFTVHHFFQFVCGCVRSVVRTTACVRPATKAPSGFLVCSSVPCASMSLMRTSSSTWPANQNVSPGLRREIKYSSMVPRYFPVTNFTKQRCLAHNGSHRQAVAHGNLRFPLYINHPVQQSPFCIRHTPAANRHRW